VTQIGWLVECISASGYWRAGRVAQRRGDFILVQVTSADGMQGQASAPDSDHLRREIESEFKAVAAPGELGGDGPPGSGEARRVRGMVATAKLDLASRRHRVPLSLWLGGAVRKAIRVMLPIVLRTEEAAPRRAELVNAARQIREGQELLGINSFAIHDSSSDVDLIAWSLQALIREAELTATLMLRLAGQFDTSQTQRLYSLLQGCGLTCIADPCSSIDVAMAASRNRLPALGLSVWKYERNELLKYLPETPPAVLLVDPLLEGGPLAVRRLASIARVLQSEICLTAEAGGAWLTSLCAELAAVVPASLQPVQLPSELSISDLRAYGVSAGTLPLRGLPSVSWPETTTDGLDSLVAGHSALPSAQR
jgi:L-alanine-DL-glutamate epimerase-like enolase superfamily enzyme